MRSFYNQPRATARTSVDQGLRAYMQRIYAYMAGGLAFTGLVAYFVATTPAIYVPLLTTPLSWVLLIVVFAIPLVLGMGIQRFSYQTAQLLFWTYAGLLGAALSSVFLMYTYESIARIFFITASVFGTMSLYGYTTKRDLTAWGSFFIMGFFGVIIAMVVNIFLQSTALQMALSVMTVLIFTGLTAYDTQRIANMYNGAMDRESQGKVSILGALSLYINFINIFLSLLRLFGDRR